MNRLIALSALFGLAMTGAAAAASAQVSVSPSNGSCPSGFELHKSASGTDDCVQTSIGTSGSGSASLSLASMSSGGDDDHGNGNEGHEGGNDSDRD